MRNVICTNEINEAMNCKVSIKNTIEVGMGATMFVGSDRYAMVVTKVIGPKKIVVNHLIDEHIDKFTTNENGIMILPTEYLEIYELQKSTDKYGNFISYNHPVEYTLRKNGRWLPKGSDMWDTCAIHVGHAENYWDPSF